MKDVKAVVFDVFGTLVDWRTSIARELQAVFGDRADAWALADAWRAEYLNVVLQARQVYRRRTTQRVTRLPWMGRSR